MQASSSAGRLVQPTNDGYTSTNDHLPPLERERGRAGSHIALLEGVKGQPAVVPTEEPSFPGEEPTA